MTTKRMVAIVVLTGVCLWGGGAVACPTPFYVWFDNYYSFAPAGDTVTFAAMANDAVQDWDYSWSPGLSGDVSGWNPLYIEVTSSYSDLFEIDAGAASCYNNQYSSTSAYLVAFAGWIDDNMTPSEVEEGSGADIWYELCPDCYWEADDVTLKIEGESYDGGRSCSRTLDAPCLYGGQEVGVYWDGKDDHGDPFDAGDYTIELTVVKDYQSITTTQGLTVKGVHVTITSPPTATAYVVAGHSINLTCQTTPATGGTITWSCSTSHEKTITYSPTGYGGHTVTVSFYYEGVTKEAQNNIVVIGIVITSPPVTIAPGASTTLTCQTYGATGGTISWGVQSGPGSYTLSPSGNGTTATFSATTAGDYIIKAGYRMGGSENPTAEDTVQVSVGPGVTITTPNPYYVRVNSPVSLYCTTYGAGGTILWSAVKPPGTVTWSPSPPNTTSPTFSANATGDYPVQVQYTIDNRTATASSTVRVVDVSLTSPSSIVNMELGDQLSLGCWASQVPNDGFSWATCPGSPSGASFLTSNTIQNPSFAPIQAGTYRVKAAAIYSGGYFWTADSPSINVATPSLTSISPSSAVSVQCGDALALDCSPSGQGGGSYLWSKNSGPGTIGIHESPTLRNPYCVMTEQGEYTVKVEYTKGGHTDTKTSGTITANAFSVTMSLPTEADFGDSVQLGASMDATPPGHYHWSADPSDGVVWDPSPDVQNPKFSSTQPGDYTITASYMKDREHVRIGASTTNGPIHVKLVDVDITSPTQETVWMPVNTSLSLACQTHGDPEGFIGWAAYTSTNELVTSYFSNRFAQNPTFTPTQPGVYRVVVYYDRAEVATEERHVNVYQLAITSPLGDGRKICFGDDGNCHFDASGTTGAGELNGYLEWALDEGPGGHQWARSPGDAKGPSVTFTYYQSNPSQKLPASNDDFGVKTLTLRLKDSQGSVVAQTSEGVGLFFNPTANTHPQFQVSDPMAKYNEAPNWFYYWATGSVVQDLDQFHYYSITEYSGEYIPPQPGHPFEEEELRVYAGTFKSFDASWDLEDPFHSRIDAGDDGIADTSARDGDIQVVSPGTQCGPHQTIVQPGHNGFLNVGIRTDFTDHSIVNTLGDDELTDRIPAHYELTCDRLGNVAATVAHEMTHRRIYHDIVEHPGDADGDGLSDSVDEGDSWWYLYPAKPDTFGIRVMFDLPGAGSGDNEFLAQMSEMDCALLVNGDADWTEGGCQYQGALR